MYITPLFTIITTYINTSPTTITIDITLLITITIISYSLITTNIFLTRPEENCEFNNLPWPPRLWEE